MKVVAGLGNPGPDYDATRHNVGWWVVDRLAYEWGFGPFRREGPALITGGTRAGHPIELVKPTTYMNRSGAAMARYRDSVEPGVDLLVVVDDAALDVGRIRIRPRGGPGGHNGLKSVSSSLGTNDFARLRIGVGQCPDGIDLSDWVLSPMDAEDEDAVVGLLPELTQAVGVWVEEGVEAAMDRFNR